MINNPNANLDALIQELDTQIQITTDLTLKDELMFLKAEVYMKKGDLLTAYNFVRDINYDRLSAISKAAVLYIRGKYFMSQGNEPQMITNFDTLISNFPKSPKTPWAMQDYALFYYNAQNYNQAKNIFFNLLTKYPDFQKVDVAYFYIGLCYEKMAENDKAKQIFTDFLEKFPNSSRKTEVQQHLSWLD
jgi:TolA-binding protein